MLTESEITKLDNPHYTISQFHWYWHNLRDKTLTEKQIKILKKICKMNCTEQRQYVIIDDELIKTPTKHKQYTLKRKNP